MKGGKLTRCRAAAAPDSPRPTSTQGRSAGERVRRWPSAGRSPDCERSVRVEAHGRDAAAVARSAPAKRLPADSVSGCERARRACRRVVDPRREGASWSGRLVFDPHLGLALEVAGTNPSLAFPWHPEHIPVITRLHRRRATGDVDPLRTDPLAPTSAPVTSPPTRLSAPSSAPTSRHRTRSPSTS